MSNYKTLTHTYTLHLTPTHIPHSHTHAHTHAHMCAHAHAHTHTHTHPPLTGESEGDLFSSSDYLEEEEEGTMFRKQGIGALFDNVEEKEEEEEEGVEGGDLNHSDLEASIRSMRYGEEMSHDMPMIHTVCMHSSPDPSLIQGFI